MSLLWKTATLTPEQHEAIARIDALPDDPERKGQVSGEAAKRFMAEHQVIQHQYAPHIDGEHEFHRDAGDTEWHEPDHELHTSQKHVWKPALREYVKHGYGHLTDSDYAFDGEESEEPYHPETYTHGDKDWISEGHHRILAKRLLGEGHEARHGYTLKDDEGGWDDAPEHP